MRSSTIPVLALGTIGAVMLATSPVHAREYPWCAQYTGFVLPLGRLAMIEPSVRSDSHPVGGLSKQADGGGSGGRNCGFDTYEQCRAAVSGVGGYCEPNLFYQGNPVPPAPARRRHRG